MSRLALLVAVLSLAFTPAGALAQDTPFGPIPEPGPTVQPAPGTDDPSRTTLYLIAAGVLVVVVGIGFAISRDARRSLPADEREALERERDRERGGRTETEDMPGQVSREARARARKQRSKAKIARESRKKNRPRR